MYRNLKWSAQFLHSYKEVIYLSKYQQYLKFNSLGRNDDELHPESLETQAPADAVQGCSAAGKD